jgi:hypothetical protein
MGLAHAAVPDERWFADLAVSGAVGVGVYGAALIVVGLLPTERAALGRLLRRTVKRTA